MPNHRDAAAYFLGGKRQPNLREPLKSYHTPYGQR